MDAVNNAAFYNSGYSEPMLSAFHKWCDLMKQKPTLDVFAKFAGRAPSTAFVYYVGEFVEAYIDGKTRYGVVAEYRSPSVEADEAVRVIAVDFPIFGRKWLKVPADREEALKFKCRLPEGLLDYAKAELLKAGFPNGAGCPLMAGRKEGGNGRLD